MKRSFKAALVAVVVAMGLLVAPVAANAAAPLCSNWSAWRTLGTNWGQYRFCFSYDSVSNKNWWRFQVDDTLTDGYAVHLEACTDWNTNPFRCDTGTFGDVVWNGVATGYPYGLESSGPVQTSGWPAFDTVVPIPSPGSRVSIRLVKGRCCSAGGHQDVAHVEDWLSN